MPAQILRVLKPSDVKCPAGELVNDVDVHCHVEDHLLRGQLEPDSVEGFCCGEYLNCSTYLAMRKVEQKGGDIRKILQSMRDEAAKARTAKALREARMRRAQRLLGEDSAEGRAFRKLLKVGEFEERRSA